MKVWIGCLELHVGQKLKHLPVTAVFLSSGIPYFIFINGSTALYWALASSSVS
jgi:hypothetical protein